ncbi:MAG: HPr family phosphocarrier protein [Desulfovibrionaceae bacterium]|nr:HPr family phosphocarrier protein [Desulfovibrionaceae bacterium]
MAHNTEYQAEIETEVIFTATVTVLNDWGLHARPAANLARIAQGFAADIYLNAGEHNANAKSILDILTLAATRHTTLTLTCLGTEAKEAGEAILRFFAGK